MTTTVSDPSASHNDKIDNAVRVIGKSRDRLAVFFAIYSGKKIKTVKEIMSLSKITNNVRVLQEGKKLASHDIVEQIKVDNETAYKKIDFYTQNRNKIVSYVKNPHRLERLPTTTRPLVKGIKISVKSNRDLFVIEPISIENIDSFSKVKKLKKSIKQSPYEKDTKKLLQKILNEKGNFTDWGGETDDLFTTRLEIKGKRYYTAFGLKGKGTKGILTPKKMGKNGDQIQRLFRSPAQVFLIQYNEQISESIVEQMKELAIAKSAKENKKIYYGIIDGADTAKLFTSYS